MKGRKENNKGKINFIFFSLHFSNYVCGSKENNSKERKILFFVLFGKIKKWNENNMVFLKLLFYSLFQNILKNLKDVNIILI